MPLKKIIIKISSSGKKLKKPIDMSVEERTSGLLKEGKDYKIDSEGNYTSLKNETPKKYAHGGLVKKGLPKLAKKGWK